MNKKGSYHKQSNYHFHVNKKKREAEGTENNKCINERERKTNNVKIELFFK